MKFGLFLVLVVTFVLVHGSSFEKKHNAHSTRLHRRKPHMLDEVIDRLENILPHKEFREPPCPLEEDIYPCTCTVGDLGPSLSCGLVTLEDLAAIFQKDFPVKEFIGLYVFDSPFLEYLENVFNGVSFHAVEFNYAGLNVVSEDFLADSYGTLDALILYYTQLDNAGFPFSSLSMYTNLLDVNIFGSRLTSFPDFQSETLRTFGVSFSDISGIPAGSLTGFPDLRNAYFETNNISSLEAGAFVGNRLLTDVDLYGDRITALVAGTFELQNNYNSITLWNNRIASVEAGTFIMPNETNQLALYLDFEGNQLTTVDEAVFGPLFPFVDVIYLVGNPLSCDCDLAWLITNPAYLDVVDSGAACQDGINLADLDPMAFENCTTIG